MKLKALLVGICLTTQAFAMPSDQKEMYQEADRLLNSTYSDLMTQLKTHSPKAIPDVIASQKLWLKFRDSECKTRQKMPASVKQTLGNYQCLTQLTQYRNDELTEVLNAF